MSIYTLQQSKAPCHIKELSQTASPHVLTEEWLHKLQQIGQQTITQTCKGDKHDSMEEPCRHHTD